MHTRGILIAALAFHVATVWAQDAFDACDVFTQADAEAALGTTAQPEPVNPKVKRPKVVTKCTYNGFKEGKPVAATAEFRFGRTEGDVRGAFGEHRLQVQTKPILISGVDAFWSSKTGQMNFRKDRTWVTLSVGPPKPADRDADQAKKAAELLVKKL
jgi:hypothetical protein